MRTYLSRVAVGLALAYGATIPACSRDNPDKTVAHNGTLSMALETVSASGKVYRLRNAMLPIGNAFDFDVTSPMMTLRSEDNPTNPVLETFLAAGDYRIRLLDGWFIEQVDDLLGTSAAVPAALISSDNQGFSIQSDQETVVNFEFQVNGERVSFGPPGRLIVTVGVQEREAGTQTGSNARRTLIETNLDALSGFTLEQVLEAAQINSGVPPDPLSVYQQIFDSYASAGVARLTDAVHCGDETTGGSPSLNGYPLRCDRLEQAQIDNLSQWFPLAAVNRIDLAPADGAHCGQQRMIFANNAFIGNGRIFMILEAEIPNPHPECGVDACAPLAQFWAAQEGIDDPVQRHNRLVEAFLTGSPELASSGFGPFMSVQNLSVGTGNIRTNNFDDSPWTIRQFKLLVDPLGQSRAVPFPVADAAHGPLWDDTSTLPAAATCRQSFLQAVDGLLPDNPAEMAFIVDESCYDAESPNDFFTQNYPLHLANGTGSFRAELEAKLAGTGLTPENIAARAQFSGSCMGCHEEANGIDLGRGAFAPFSTGFVQVSEQFIEDCGDGSTCFGISQALRDVFLPHRMQAMSTLLGRPIACGGVVVADAGGDAGAAVDGGGIITPPPPLPGLSDAGVTLPVADGGSVNAPADGGIVVVAADGGSVVLSSNTVLTPNETISDLVVQEQAVRGSLTGQTLGGQPAGITH